MDGRGCEGKAFVGYCEIVLFSFSLSHPVLTSCVSLHDCSTFKQWHNGGVEVSRMTKAVIEIFDMLFDVKEVGAEAEDA